MRGQTEGRMRSTGTIKGMKVRRDKRNQIVKSREDEDEGNERQIKTTERILKKSRTAH